MSISEKLTKIAENEQKVYEAGYTDGKAEGGGSAVNEYELIDDVTLTEDVSMVSFTQDRSGNPLTDYKDFFLYFCGSFTTELNNTAVRIRANGGSYYFMWKGFSKGTTWRGFWHSIEEHEITDGDGITRMLFKSTYPASFLFNVIDGNITSQGLADNNQALYSDLTVGSTATKISSYDISTGEDSIFATGSRFLLFGRRR